MKKKDSSTMTLLVVILAVALITLLLVAMNFYSQRGNAEIAAAAPAEQSECMRNCLNSDGPSGDSTCEQVQACLSECIWSGSSNLLMCGSESGAGDGEPTGSCFFTGNSRGTCALPLLCVGGIGDPLTEQCGYQCVEPGTCTASICARSSGCFDFLRG